MDDSIVTMNEARCKSIVEVFFSNLKNIRMNTSLRTQNKDKYEAAINVHFINNFIYEYA